MSNNIDLAWNIVQDEQYNDQKRRKFLSTLYQIDLRYCLYVHIHQELRSVVHRKRIVWLGYRLGASKENIVLFVAHPLYKTNVIIINICFLYI